jgi:hypothetical protein
MDELAVEKPKRRTHASRLKRRIEYLDSDIAALERLIETLLGHLERAIGPEVTDADRQRYRQMIGEVRVELSEPKSEGLN